MVVVGLTWCNNSVALDDCSLAMVSLWAYCTLPIGSVKSPRANVVGESQTVNQFGTPPLGAFYNKLKAGSPSDNSASTSIGSEKALPETEELRFL